MVATPGYIVLPASTVSLAAIAHTTVFVLHGPIVLPVNVFCSMATPPMTVYAKPVLEDLPTKPISTLVIHGYIVLPASTVSLAVVTHTTVFVLHGLIVLPVSVFCLMVMPPMTVYARPALEGTPTKPISTLVIHG